jgi:ribonuclease D
VQWVERTEQLIEIAGDIGAGPLAVDTEADSLHHYREKVCLIQLSFGGRDVLVDTLAGVDVTPLAASFADRSVRKILHGADYDVRMLRRDCGLEVAHLFDTMIAARLVGERSFSLAALLERYLGVRVDKRHQRADWSLRPLPAEMARYAVLDTRHLSALAAALENRLRELGRSAWAEEEFRHVERLRWESDRREGDVWLRVKGTRALDRRQCAVVREIAGLRERVARERDVPPFRVMRDEVVVALARVSTETAPKDPLAVRGLPRAWRAGRRAGALREAIGRALALKEREWPELRRSAPRPRRTRAAEARLKRLRRRRDAIARDLGIEPSLLAPRALLESLVDLVEAGRPIAEAPRLRTWQRDLLGPAFFEEGQS